MPDDDDLLGKVPAKQLGHVPTLRNHVMVRQMARVGIPKPQIARELGIGLPTLERYYSDTLERAEVHAVNRVLNVIYREALDGKEWAIDRFLKARAKKHRWIAEEWGREKAETGSDIRIEFDAVGAISSLLTNLKRGELDKPPVLIEQKDDDDD